MSVIAAVLMFPLLNTELAPQTDEGVVQVSAELAAGTRIERTDAIMCRLEQMIATARPRSRDDHRECGAGGGGGGGGWAAAARAAGSSSCSWCRRIKRKRSSDQIAFELRRQLSGIPGVIVRANASGGNNQLNRLMSGGQNNDGRMGSKSAAKTSTRPADSRWKCKDLMETTPGIADARLGRDEARPELAVQIDRPKAALFGLNTTQVANTIRTNVAGTIAAQFRQGGYEYPIVVRLSRKIASRCRDVNDVMVITPGGVALPVKNVMTIQSQLGPVADRSQEPGAHHHRQRGS